jgi:hypothetical protein
MDGRYLVEGELLLLMLEAAVLACHSRVWSRVQPCSLQQKHHASSSLNFAEASRTRVAPCEHPRGRIPVRSNSGSLPARAIWRNLLQHPLHRASGTDLMTPRTSPIRPCTAARPYDCNNLLTARWH